jgi:hypothetical protein
MKSFTTVLVFVLAFFGITEVVYAQECSTEKVNGDCTVTIDRRYPVTMPTIQMRRKRQVTVIVIHSTPFESLTLDPQTQAATALAGTDQTAGFVTAAFPYAKALTVTTSLDISRQQASEHGD